MSGALQGDDVTEAKQGYCNTVSHPVTLQANAERRNGGDEEKGDVHLGNDTEGDPTRHR